MLFMFKKKKQKEKANKNKKKENLVKEEEKLGFVSTFLRYMAKVTGFEL